MTIAARKAISDQLVTTLGAGWPTMPVQVDPNASFTPPDNVSWARVIFLEGDEAQVGIGGAASPLRTPLLAFIDLFEPAGIGDGDSVAKAEAVKTGLRRFNGGGARWARFRAGPEGRGQGDAAALYRRQIIAVFTISHRG
jgi:hypothetical protein